MLVGGDLGFLCLVLVVVVVLIFPIIGVVLRRKWLFAAARREEIKRLLILASEESARAELGAITGYGVGAAASVSLQLRYQCVVCFCPSTTRCAFRTVLANVKLFIGDKVTKKNAVLLPSLIRTMTGETEILIVHPPVHQVGVLIAQKIHFLNLLLPLLDSGMDL